MVNDAKDRASRRAVDVAPGNGGAARLVLLAVVGRA